MRGTHVGFLATLCLVSAAPALAEEPLWKSVGDWEIRVDRSLNYGCFMYGSYHNGELLRIGFDRKNANGYIMLGSPAWKSLEVGKEYKLTFKFDDSPWEGVANAVSLDGSEIKFLYMIFNKPNLIRDISTKQLLTVEYNGNLVTRLPLTGTVKAVEELLNCQTTFNNEGAGDQKADSGDPFAKPAKDHSAPDPFRQ